MNKQFFCVLTTILSLTFCFRSNAQNTDAFRIGDHNNLIVSPESAMLVNAEVYSVQRERIIAGYRELLSDANEGVRAFACWALGKFQSHSALEALLQQGARDRSPIVIDQIYSEIEAVWQLYAFTSMQSLTKRDEEAQQRTLIECLADYKRIGYRDLIRRGWKTAQSRGSETTGLFVKVVANRFDPDLADILLDILERTSGPPGKDLRQAFLCWTAIDTEKAGGIELRRALTAGDLFSVDRLRERYRSYFEAIGFHTLVNFQDEIGLAILAAKEKPEFRIRRDMAYRLVSCELAVAGRR